MADQIVAPPDWAARITFTIEMVGPQQAVAWLERNTLNRDIIQRHVEWLARLMRDGQWGISSDAICFAETGRVLNGQHRLWAVIEAGKTVVMLVGRGYPESSQRIIDTGRRRSAMDTAKIDGVQNLRRHYAAAARCMMERASGYNVRLASNADISDYLQRVLPGLEFAAEQVFRVKQSRGFTHAGMHAVIAQAFFTQPAEDLIAFGDVLVIGEPNRDPGSKAALLLRDFMIRPAQGQKHNQAAVYRRTQTALDAYLRNNTLRTLDESRAQLFPLPNDLFTKNGDPA